MGSEDLTVIGHASDLLVDIYTAKYGAYLHFTVVLNDGGEDAQFERLRCAIWGGILSVVDSLCYIFCALKISTIDIIWIRVFLLPIRSLSLQGASK